jgi:hypothetical protein
MEPDHFLPDVDCLEMAIAEPPLLPTTTARYLVVDIYSRCNVQGDTPPPSTPIPTPTFHLRRFEHGAHKRGEPVRDFSLVAQRVVQVQVAFIVSEAEVVPQGGKRGKALDDAVHEASVACRQHDHDYH